MILLRQLPNVLTALRLVAAPFAAYFILQGDGRAALLVFAIAAASDALDGYLARTFRITSKFGLYLDPVADKFLMFLVLLSLLSVAAIPKILGLLIIARDVFILFGVGMSFLLSMPLQVKPLMIGKITTVVQVSYILLVLLTMPLSMDMNGIMLTAALATAAVTIASWAAYTLVWFRAFLLRHAA